jgi:hypothetical protein
VQLPDGGHQNGLFPTRQVSHNITFTVLQSNLTAPLFFSIKAADGTVKHPIYDPQTTPEECIGEFGKLCNYYSAKAFFQPKLI